MCYLLSQTLVKGFILEFKPGLVKKFKGMVESNKSSLWVFVIFLRMSPIIPNWFVNLASPIVGIPLTSFYLGTFLGLIPFNYIHVQTGNTLNNINKFGASLNQLILLFALSLLLMLPTLINKIRGGSDKPLKDDKSKKEQ